MLAEFDIKYTSPVICTAIHNGHELSPFVEAKMNLTEFQRFYEEDPYTEIFIEDCENKIIANFSRFEVDLNRNKDKCIYQNPEDAWGLKVRTKDFSAKEINDLLSRYDEFYGELMETITKLKEEYKTVFIFDIHSYNYRRNGIEADPKENPEIILGTNNMPEKYLPLIYKIKSKFEEFVFFGRKLDVRINVKFTGGNMSRWIHDNFDDVISLSVEFKKIFMDELTGELHNEMILELKRIFNTVKKSVEEELNKNWHARKDSNPQPSDP